MTAQKKIRTKDTAVCHLSHKTTETRSADLRVPKSKGLTSLNLVVGAGLTGYMPN